MFVTTLEFWPDYGPGPIWLNGSAIAPAEILSASLAKRVRLWNDAYDEAKLETENDPAWTAEGKRLLDAVRAELADTHEVIVTES